jgi:hypothetical protein
MHKLRNFQLKLYRLILDSMTNHDDNVGSMYGPALKSLLARTAGPEEQGALQGHMIYAITCL